MIRSCFASAIKKLCAMFGGRAMIPVTYLLLALCFAATGAVTSASLPEKVTCAVYDACGGELSADFIEELAAADGMRVIERDSREGGEDELLRGHAEVLLVLDADYDARLVSEEPGSLIELVTAPGAVSAELLRETAAGILLAQRTLALTRSELAADGYDVSLLYKYIMEFELPRLYTVKTWDGGSKDESGVHALFGSAYSCYEGVAALALLLLMLTLSKRLGDGSSRLVALRLYSLPKGRTLAFSSDALALYIAGLGAGAAAFVFCPAKSLWFALGLAAYAFCISGLCLLLSGLHAAGRIDIAAPFIALITSVAGGCFADLASLSPALRVIARCTPQGQLIAASKGEPLFALLLLFEGAALMLICAIAGRRNKAIAFSK